MEEAARIIYTAYDLTDVQEDQLKLAVHKKIMTGGAADIARLAAPKTAQFIYNIMRVGPKVILRNVFELLRANTFTRILSTAALLSIDTASFIRRRISRKQYIVNLISALLLVAGGAAGWLLGGGAADLLSVNNAAAALALSLSGAVIAGSALYAAFERLAGLFVTSDADEMLAFLNRVFISLAAEYRLNRREIGYITDELKINAHILQNIFGSGDREKYCRDIFEPYISGITAQRSRDEPHGN